MDWITIGAKTILRDANLLAGYAPKVSARENYK
jgi:hypothetical protein